MHNHLDSETKFEIKNGLLACVNTVSTKGWEASQAIQSNISSCCQYLSWLLNVRAETVQLT